MTDTAPESEPDVPSTGRPGEELAPSTLVDRYQIDHRLGAGGMGVVYAARDIHLGRAVAVKVVGPRVDVESGQGRLVREAQAMAKLRHPNLATVYDLRVTTDRLFVVMELIDGGTLAAWSAAAARPWRELVAMYLQAARGLAAAHAAGFVHRDFKPENVLVGNDGIARVSDFGVAGILGEQALVGTPGFIAPEILRHEPVDGRADQFSFCVALYAALCGERPFAPGDDARRLFETQGPLRPAPLRARPRWLVKILTRGLAQEPRDRWPSMGALIQVIERRLERRRRTWLAAALAVVAVGATIALVVGTRAPPPAVQAWSPVVIGRERPDSPLGMIVSRDGSTVAGISAAGAWVEPRAGGGTRRAITFPVRDTLDLCRLSRTGARMVCGFTGGFEIWAIELATQRATRLVTGGRLFDVGPDDSILFGTLDLARLERRDAAGAVQPIATIARPELITAGVWSPDGTRIAYKVRTADGARIEIVTLASLRTHVISRRICKELEWLSDVALACAPRSFRKPLVIELRLGDGVATERVRYDGPEYQQISRLSASAAGVLVSTSPNDQHLALVSPGGEVQRIASGGVTDLPAAGWTDAGRLIFGASEQGHLRIKALDPDGTITTVRTGPTAEVPLVVAGESVVFGRFPGGEATIPFFETPVGRRFPDGELFRLTLATGAVASLGATRGFSSLSCSTATGPCLIAERDGAHVIARAWDLATGARGAVRARWLATSFASTVALSPDGRTLAQVQRLIERRDLSLLELGTGTRRTIDLPGTALDFPRWLPDGTLVAVRSRGGERGLVRVTGAPTLLLAVPPAGEPLTLAGEFQIAPDGRAAVLLTDSLQTHSWVQFQN